MKAKFLILMLGLSILGCKSSRFHEYADYNKNLAYETILNLKNEDPIVVLPTYSKKEKQLKNLLIKDSSNSQVANQKLLSLYAERELRAEAILSAFSEYYTFSNYLFIPDSLLSAFESQPEGSYFLDKNGQFSSDIQYNGSAPVKIIQRFDKEWQVMVGNKLAPNPFPNNFTFKRAICKPFNNRKESYQEIYDCVAQFFLREFDEFYKKAQ